MPQFSTDKDGVFDVQDENKLYFFKQGTTIVKSISGWSKLTHVNNRFSCNEANGQILSLH